MKNYKSFYFLKNKIYAGLCVAILATPPLMAAGASERAKVLDSHEVAELVFMREEEKLARDVYSTLYQRWQQPIFNNIAQSEQRHTNSVKRLLGMYGLADPISNDSVGVFANAELAVLYQQLITKGERSLLDAFYVGAFIEEVDIQDLQRAIQGTDEVRLQRVYANLERGSRNHLRAFVAQIEAQGMVYTAQAMNQVEVDAIINSPSERGIGARRGQGRGHHGRAIALNFCCKVD